MPFLSVYETLDDCKTNAGQNATANRNQTKVGRRSSVASRMRISEYLVNTETGGLGASAKWFNVRSF